MAKRNARKKVSSRHLGIILIVTGTLLVSLSTLHNLLRYRSLRVDRATVQAYLNAQPVEADQTSSYPSHIFIQWRVDVDIDSAVYANGDWTISPSHASYLATSGRVGKGGNIVIYGHNKREILGNIRVLKLGELITLTTEDGVQHDYQVQLVKEVSPSDTSLVQPTQEETLTLYTCSGLLDSRRFVVQAKPVNR